MTDPLDTTNTALWDTPYAGGASVHLSRPHCQQAVLSPSITGLSSYTLISQLITNERLLMACSRSHYNEIIRHLSELVGSPIGKISAAVQHLDDLDNPFDNLDVLSEVIEPDYLAQDIQTQIDLCATGLLANIPEARELEEEWKDIVDIFPVAIPFFQMRARWMPLAYRTRFLLNRLTALDAVYVSTDDYEVKLHDYIFYFGRRDSLSIHAGLEDRSLLPRIDHRPYIFNILIRLLPMKSENQGSRGHLGGLLKNNKAKIDLSRELESIANLLYEPPYYLSERELEGRLTNEFIGLVRALTPTSARKAMYVMGNIPFPFSLPNPIGLYTAFNDYIQNKRLTKEFGWLMHFVNLAGVLPYFRQVGVPPIPGISAILLRDDVIHTVACKKVLNKRSNTLHHAQCSHLRKVNRSDVRLLLDDLGNWPNVDARLCSTCLGN